MKIDKEIVDFLTDLANNNNREWFAENKERYKSAADKFNVFVDSMIAKIATFDSSVANLQAKDTVFRIYKDVRFSKDKLPYKNHFGAYICPGGRKSTKAGYYIHIEPISESFIGGGIHCPQPKELKAIRSEIYYNVDKYKSIINNSDFKKTYGTQFGDKLKTAPKGFDKEFEDLELIKYKEYSFGKFFDNDYVQADSFSDNLIADFKTLKPYNDFLNEAVYDL